MASKRTILITGCSDGTLGSHLAFAFHRAGWRVLASARNLKKLGEVQSAGIETIQLDITSEESISQAVSQVSELTNGSLDVLLNNAGAGYSMPLMDLDLTEARKLFDLNVWSIISMTRAFLPLLSKSQHGGMVVNNTSVSGTTAGATPFIGAYAASKAGAISITEVMRLELAPFGIKVVNMMTGAVRSHFFDNTPTPKLPSTSLYNISKESVERALSGKDIEKEDPTVWANSIVQSLSKPKPSYLIWQGKFAGTIRAVLHLPIGLMDSTVKKMNGLDVLEAKVKEQGGPRAALAKLLLKGA